MLKLKLTIIKKLNEYKYERKDDWEKFKIDFNRDMETVSNAVKDIFSRKE